MDVLNFGISRDRFDRCNGCDRVHAGTQVCTGGRGCAVYEKPAINAQRACQDRGNEVFGSKAASKRSVLKTIGAIGGLFGLSILAGCGTMQMARTTCSDTDHVTRFTEAQIDAMSDEQVKQELARNEDLVRRGCAVPNK